MKYSGTITELKDNGPGEVQMFYTGYGCMLTTLEAQQVAIGDLVEVETDHRLNQVVYIKINDKVIREAIPEQFHCKRRS